MRRRRSQKTAALYDANRAARDQFLADMNYACAWCGCSTYSVHEMTPGKNRLRGFECRAAWLAACDGCNCILFPDKVQFPLAKQLALKLITDPAYFDLAEIRRILAPDGCTNPPIVVTEGEVLEAVRELLTARMA